jgi:hypothetical protein
VHGRNDERWLLEILDREKCADFSYIWLRLGLAYDTDFAIRLPPREKVHQLISRMIELDYVEVPDENRERFDQFRLTEKGLQRKTHSQSISADTNRERIAA